jgi:hypothetical protein
MPPAYPDPKKWTRDELADARLLAIADFIAGRTAEGGGTYTTFMADTRAQVEALFAATNNLRSLTAATLLGDVTLAGPLRYLAGPPISADDLSVMADARRDPRAYIAGEADRIVELMKLARDTLRMPWLDPDRDPAPGEVEAAVLATASLWSAQKVATKRRNESSKAQEAQVQALLVAEGFTEVDRLPINAPDDLAPGTFCGETRVAGTRCDIPVRLLNRRLLLIECKVSNSKANSKKRLINDVGEHVGLWRREFGAQQYTMAVLSGVYSLDNLVTAQDTREIAIVWQRDLAPLADFLRAAR